MTRVYVYINDMLTFCNGSCNLGRKCIISEERFVLELPTSCAMLATARPFVVSVKSTIVLLIAVDFRCMGKEKKNTSLTMVFTC